MWRNATILSYIVRNPLGRSRAGPDCFPPSRPSVLRERPAAWGRGLTVRPRQLQHRLRTARCPRPMGASSALRTSAPFNDAARGWRRGRGSTTPWSRRWPRAFRWRKLLDTGVHAMLEDLARAKGVALSFVSRVLRLTLLSSETVEAILDGRQLVELQLDDLLAGFPLDWEGQQRASGSRLSSLGVALVEN